MVAPTPEMASVLNRHQNAVLAVHNLKQKLKSLREDRDYPHNLQRSLAINESRKVDLERTLKQCETDLECVRSRLDPEINAAAISETAACLETAEAELAAACAAKDALSTEEKTKPTIDKLQAQLAQLSQEEIVAMLQAALKGNTDAAAS